MSTQTFASAVISPSPSDELGEHAALYAWLIGGWSVRAVDYLADKTTMETRGEWYFSWVLEGRAVQDVWIAPSRDERTKDTPKVRNRYGSTIRMFDPQIKQWVVYWFNPVSGATDKLIAMKVGLDIVQSGADSEGNLMRWVFTNIQSESFRWYGERSFDQGSTWVLEADFYGIRMK